MSHCLKSSYYCPYSNIRLSLSLNWALIRLDSKKKIDESNTSCETDIPVQFRFDLI